MMNITYKRLRGPAQVKRCIDTLKGRLYCDCGCQEPHDNDPAINLAGITVISRAPHGYADYRLDYDGVTVGEINTQYCALHLRGHEYLGCNREQLRPIFNQIFDSEGKNKFPRPTDTGAGDTVEETVATVRLAERLTLAEQDDRNKAHPGYCNQCHSYCYGDCLSN